MGTLRAALSADSDNDGVVDDHDNCPAIANPDQANANGVGPGDACELALVFLPGNANKFARFQSPKDPVVSTAPFALSGSPDLLRVRAVAPSGATAYQQNALQRLGVQSPGEHGNGDSESIANDEVLEVEIGNSGALRSAKASEVWLRLDGLSTLQVQLFDDSSLVGSEAVSNQGIQLRRFAANGQLFTRVQIRTTSGRVGLRGFTEAIMFTIEAQPECPSGYARVGRECVDIDECSAGARLCDALTSCTNLPGSFACGACPEGYQGTGRTGCIDVDECAQGTDLCSDLVTCSNQAGSYTCGECPSGYRGDGRTCVDINESCARV